MNHYEKLCQLSKRAHLLDGISGLLGWDQETYMPEKAAPVRAMQKELLAELSHTVKIGPDFANTLQQLIDIETGTILLPNADMGQIAALKAWRRDFLRFKKLPTSFVQEFTKVTSEAIFVWDKAKKENTFSLFEPYLRTIVELLKQKADYIGYSEHPYDALIDEFEPGFTTREIETLFAELTETIPTLLSTIIKTEKKRPQTNLEATFSIDEQIAICRKVLDLIGYDFSRGRLDLSSHPFSSSYHPYDCRITTRTEAHGFITQVLTTLHEAGHSFYEMGLPVEHYGTPLGEAISLGVHESQSRFWETRIGRTAPFWKMLCPIIQQMFPHKKDQLNLTDTNGFFREISRVAPTFIRTDSDEVTYPLHIILRFQIEKELLEGKLHTQDLPERWNSGMQKLLGITPTTDREGCLQDIHWSMGAFGYFPTYTLGNVFAAQLFQAFETSHPDWEERIARAEFEFIKEWQRCEIHCHGRRYLGRELIEKISKKPLSSKPYITYLEEKYGKIGL